MTTPEELSETELEVDSEENEESKEETEKIEASAILRRILNSQLPLSQNHPGYLVGFLNMLETEEELPAQLENALLGFQKAVKLWSYNTGRASKKGVIEYLQSCKNQTGNLFETSFDSKILESVKTFLNAYKKTTVTEEDCSRYVEKLHMSTSLTTATSATERADATGTKKRKLMDLNNDEIDVPIVDQPAEERRCPIFPTYTSITANKEDNLCTRKLEDSWKEFSAKITIWKTEKLKPCASSSLKWQYKHQEIEINYDGNTDLSRTMNRIKIMTGEYLNAKNARWDIRKKPNYKQFKY
jgi:hypothetical protein